jgi:ankyrin repeat protein
VLLPLLCAALRGHLPVVEVLLRHLSAAGVDWMQEGLYGDAWTPLMAAAVANRVDVALCLLRAANGFTAGSNKLQQLQQQRDSSKQLAGDGKGAALLGGNGVRNNGKPNGVKYQNHAHAYHQQRRRNTDVSSVEAAGVERLLAAENRYGQTALHIAARKGCRELLQLLLCYGAVRVAGQVVDTAGETWTDVARRHGHGVALRELLQQC